MANLTNLLERVEKSTLFLFIKFLFVKPINMVVLLVVILCVIFLNIKNLKKTHKNKGILKKLYDKKLKIKNKLLFYNLTNFEKKLLFKVKNNFVSLDLGDIENFYEELENLKINKNFPTFKIDICEDKNLNRLNKYLVSLKKIENISFKTNIVVVFKSCKEINYRDILYLVSKYGFLSVVKIFDESMLSIKQMAIINILNINREDDDCFKTEETNVTVFGKKYFFKNFEFKNFCYVSKISDDKFFIKKIKTYDYEKKAFYEKFYFENLTNKNIFINLNYFFCADFSGQAYVKTDFHKFKNYIDYNDEKIFLYSNVIFDNKKVGKNSTKFLKKIMLKANSKTEIIIAKTHIEYEKTPTENMLYNDMDLVATKYLKFPKLRIKTENKALDNLINFHLPQNIIKNYICSPKKYEEDFGVLLGEISPLKLSKKDYSNKLNSHFIRQVGLGEEYINLLYNLVGVVFLKTGICLSKFKKQILPNAEIYYYLFDDVLKLETKKIGLNNLSYKIGDVEYTNIETVSYEILRKNKNKVLHF